MENERRLNDIRWSEYKTAYGSAEIVETQLARLSSENLEVAMKASHDLWCGLCHQHAYVSSAASPAFPFLMEVFNKAGEKLKVELLDIFLGFAVCLKRSETHEPWEADLLKVLHANAQIFKNAQASENEDISSFADEIISNLTL